MAVMVDCHRRSPFLEQGVSVRRQSVTNP
jgi:hypothetical protein